MADMPIALKQPVWVEAPAPPQFAHMIDKAWYYKTDIYYLALVFRPKVSERAMAIYHLKSEARPRNEKFATAEEAMASVQRTLSENQAHVKTWGH